MVRFDLSGNGPSKVMVVGVTVAWRQRKVSSKVNLLSSCASFA